MNAAISGASRRKKLLATVHTPAPKDLKRSLQRDTLSAASTASTPGSKVTPDAKRVMLSGVEDLVSPAQPRDLFPAQPPVTWRIIIKHIAKMI